MAMNNTVEQFILGFEITISSVKAGVHILQIYGNLFPKFMRKSRHFRISLHLVRAPILVRIFINGLNSPFPLPSLWIISVYQ